MILLLGQVEEMIQLSDADKVVTLRSERCLFCVVIGSKVIIFKKTVP